MIIFEFSAIVSVLFPGNSDEKWVATQLIVWEIVSGCRETSGSYNCTNTKYINGITAGGANSGVKSAYNQIISNMQAVKKIPSFAADSTGSAKTYEMNASGGSYSLTLTDNNSVLGRFDFKSTGGVTVSRSGNKLTLTAKSPITSAVTLSASRSVSGVGVSLNHRIELSPKKNKNIKKGSRTSLK